MPPLLPVMLNLAGRKVVIVGGQAVALRRANSLLAAGAAVVVVAPQIASELAALPVECRRRPFVETDLDDALLVVVATDQPVVNEQVARAAAARGILTNRADEPAAGQVQIPAHDRRGPITVAVHTDGASARAGALIRDELLAQLDPDWPALLEAVAALRPLVQAQVDDAHHRQHILRMLISPAARTALHSRGREGLRAYCEQLLAEAPPQPKP